MELSTRNSLLGKIADKLGLNKTFSKYTKVDVDPVDTAIISPVEARVMQIGNISNKGTLISKNNKEIPLIDLIGRYANQFLNAMYINFYLNPSNKHFWVTPYNGIFMYTQINDGKSWLPAYTGLENLLGIEMFNVAAKKNASIGSVFKTKNYLLAIIAIGSLNVNRIHIDYDEMQYYPKGTPCGYFSIGSTLLLCFPNNLKLLIEEKTEVKIGQRILI